MIERLAAGGPLMVPIALVSLLAWAFIVERWLWLRAAGDPARLLRALSGDGAPRDAREASELCARDPGIAGSVARSALEASAGAPPGAIEDLLREASLREMGAARRGLSAIALFASVAPLLGLLGTVTGMIETFDAITIYGTGNPRPLAEGISEALITTQAGLVVALPILLACNVLVRRSDRFERGAKDVFDRVRAFDRAQEGKEESP